jgi:hypothetical protein
MISSEPPHLNSHFPCIFRISPWPKCAAFRASRLGKFCRASVPSWPFKMPVSANFAEQQICYFKPRFAIKNTA